MKKATVLTLLLLTVSILQAAPKEKEEAWIQQCKNFKIFGISLGMTPDQVRLVFLKVSAFCFQTIMPLLPSCSMP